MSFDEIVKRMASLFGIITTGALLSMCLFLAVFAPSAALSVKDIIGIPIIGLAADLPLLVFLSRKELSYQAMLVRKIIHCVVTGGVVLAVAALFQWVSITREPVKVLFFFATYAAVYMAASLADYVRQKRDSDKINLALKERSLPPR